jgi:hypothetical protein
MGNVSQEQIGASSIDDLRMMLEERDCKALMMLKESKVET